MQCSRKSYGHGTDIAVEREKEREKTATHRRVPCIIHVCGMQKMQSSVVKYSHYRNSFRGDNNRLRLSSYRAIKAQIPLIGYAICAYAVWYVWLVAHDIANANLNMCFVQNFQLYSFYALIALYTYALPRLYGL